MSATASDSLGRPPPLYVTPSGSVPIPSAGTLYGPSITVSGGGSTHVSPGGGSIIGVVSMRCRLEDPADCAQDPAEDCRTNDEDDAVAVVGTACVVECACVPCPIAGPALSLGTTPPLKS